MWRGRSISGSGILAEQPRRRYEPSRSIGEHLIQNSQGVLYPFGVGGG